MIWNTQEKIDHHVKVRMLARIPTEFKQIDEMVKFSWFSAVNSGKFISNDSGSYKKDFFLPTKPRIVTAANRYGDLIILGVRHHCPIMNLLVNQLGGNNRLSCYSRLECLGELRGCEQGFVDQFGNFLSREEAMVVALEMGQVINDIGYNGDSLFSEHLY